MRNESELVSDFFRLPSFEWNLKLAQEFRVDLSALIVAMNDYHYSQPSESTIKDCLEVETNSEEVTEYVESILSDKEEDEEIVVIKDVLEIAKLISTVRRDFTNAGTEAGRSYRSCLFFGINFTSIDFPTVIFEGCVFNNCTFTDCVFTSSFISSGKIVECLFNKCDLSDITFSKMGFFGVNFIDCDLENTRFFDCVQHITSYYNCDLDGCNITTGSLHRSDYESSSLKRSTIAGVIASNCNINNSNLKGSNILNNRFIGCNFDKIHIESAFQTANAYLGCSFPPELDEFFVDELEVQPSDEDEDESGLKERTFDEIMNDEDADDMET